MSHSAVYQNTNGVPLANGKNLHMDIGHGEISNRIITVGAVSRAEKVAAYLDKEPKPIKISSSRGFTTITGFYNGVGVSIVAIGMGPSMMDFFVRETRAVTDGPLAIVRFGTCGGLAADSLAGRIAVCGNGSGYVCRNPDAFEYCYSHDAKHSDVQPYNYHKIAPADSELSQLVIDELRSATGSDTVVVGTNVTAESFYSTQGRIDPAFHDNNEGTVDHLLQHYPDAKSLEMESFMLLHLAKCCKIPIKATAAAIVVAHRPTGQVVDGDTLDHLEDKGGKAILDAIIKVSL